MLGDEKIKRNEAPRYLDEQFWSAYRLWKNWKRFGLPNGNGWANEPEGTIEVINLFEDEFVACKNRDDGNEVT